MPRRSRLLARVASTAATALLVVGCGDHGDGLLKGKLDIGLTTTTGTTSCDAVVVAERAISEATFEAIRADAAARAVTEQRFAELRASLPAELTDDVGALLEAAFRKAWQIGPSGGVGDGTIAGGKDFEDPFESNAYIAADQAIRQYADACSGPRSTGDPSRAPTTSELPPSAMTIPLPPGEPPPGAT